MGRIFNNMFDRYCQLYSRCFFENMNGKGIKNVGFQKLPIPKVRCNTYQVGMKTGTFLQWSNLALLVFVNITSGSAYKFIAFVITSVNNIKTHCSIACCPLYSKSLPSTHHCVFYLLQNISIYGAGQNFTFLMMKF